jgi:hypothetical protein
MQRLALKCSLLSLNLHQAVCKLCKHVYSHVGSNAASDAHRPLQQLAHRQGLFPQHGPLQAEVLALQLPLGRQ